MAILTEIETDQGNIQKTLCQAFDTFSHLSQQLVDSNQSLHIQLQQLKNRLQEAEQQRLQEMVDKVQISDRFENLLDILPAAIIILDETGKVSQSNPSAHELLGFNTIHLSWVEIIQTCFSPRLDDGHEISLKNGRKISLQTRSLANGLGQIIVMHDLTETRLLQEQLSKQKHLLELGKMTAALAHQIRTPLSSAMLYVSQMESELLSDEKRIEFSHRVMGSLQHLEQQIKDMLLFTRSEIPLSHSIRLGEFFSQLKITISPILEKTNAYLILEIADSNLSLLCNKDALLGAFINLINNSIEAVHDSAKILIQSTLNEQQELMILIEDEGPGISESMKKSIFEPFFSTKENGTGLGLAVVASVAQAHQAKFELGSGKQGAQFIWTFPSILLDHCMVE